MKSSVGACFRSICISWTTFRVTEEKFFENIDLFGVETGTPGSIFQFKSPSIVSIFAIMFPLTPGTAVSFQLGYLA